MPIRDDIEQAISLLNDGDKHQRKSAAMKLGRIREKESIPALLNAAKNDEYPLTRVFALQSLAWIADHSIIDDLHDILKTDNEELVKITIIDILKTFYNQGSLDLLIEITNDSHSSNKIRNAASIAVGVIQGMTQE